MTYKTLPEYHQAPGSTSWWLPHAAGRQDRLPKEPQVYLKTGMKDGIGVYGDLWRGFSAAHAGYNEMAGVSMGWFGIESYTDRYQSLVKTGPLYRASQDIEPCLHWPRAGWSADGKTRPCT